ncbi:MAG: WD40 repeat domain-containing protein [Anaerolineaceae bacterium]|nr:WD40 repeat domain-containing protein [Anaerolineaceae bacterium]
MMRYALWTILFIFAVSLAACGPGEPQATPTPDATPTPIPTATPEPFLPASLEPITAENVSALTLFQEYADHPGVAFSADGTLLVLTGNTLALVDLAAGIMTNLVDMAGQNYDTAISADNRYIGYMTENDEGKSVTRIWDTETNTVVMEASLSRFGLVFIPGTDTLVLGDNGLPMLDAANGEPVAHTIQSRSTTSVLGVMPDGKQLVTSSNAYLVFDSLDTYEETQSWDFSTKIDGTTVAPALDALAISKDGTLVAVGLNASEARKQLRTIQIWDAESNAALQVIPWVARNENARVVSAAFSPDNSLLAVGFDDWNFNGHVDVYAVATGELVGELAAPAGVHQITFNADGTLLALGTTLRGGSVIYSADA